MITDFLTQHFPMEKHLFLIPRFALKIIGFYPETRLTNWLKCWALFNILVLGYGCFAEFHYGIYYLPINIPTALDALCPVASSIMSFVKIFFIWWYRDEYKNLIDEVRRLTELQTGSEKIKIKRYFFTMATRLNALVFFFGFCTSTSYTVRSILLNTIRLSNGEDWSYDTPFKMM